MSLTLESSIFEYFCQTRENRTKLHKLIDIVAIAILAVIEERRR